MLLHMIFVSAGFLSLFKMVDVDMLHKAKKSYNYLHDRLQLYVHQATINLWLNRYLLVADIHLQC